MMNLKSVDIHITPLENGAFFISVLDDESHPISPAQWKQQLFIWHEESFYGSFIESKQVNGDDGIEIDSYSLLTLLGHERFSSLIDWNWCEPGDAILAVAPIMLEAIQEGNGSRSLRMTLKKLLLESSTDGMGRVSSTILGAKLFHTTMNEFVTHFYHHAVTAHLEQGMEGATLAAKLKQLKESPLSAEELEQYFDETRWIEWTETVDPPLPSLLVYA
ncbi:hypothetical protein ACI2OX_19955 [Bacillus sp. N9]